MAANSIADTPPRQVVVLVNPISGHGHLDSYARLYTRALVQLGYSVILVAETNAGLHCGRETHVYFLSLAELEQSGYRPTPTFESARPIASIVAKVGHLYATGGAFAIFEHAALTVQNLIRGGLRRRTWPTSFDKFVAAIDRVTQKWGHPPALAVFLYLDPMECTRRAVRRLEGLGNLPWVGILFHPAALHAGTRGIEHFFSAANARGAIFLIPEAKEVYAAALPRQTFTLAPDVADLMVAPDPPAWIRSMRDRAGGRTVVLQVGTITPHKGVKQLLEVIRLADSSRFFFVIVGEPHWNLFGEEREDIQTFFARPPENVYAQLGYLQSEADYNALICTCDIIYAVYQGFGGSSNALTKAAGLRRRILVSEESLMGRRVTEAGIGGIAPSHSPEAILAALEQLAQQSAARFRFEEYAARHSLDELQRVLAEAMPRWQAPPAPAAIGTLRRHP